MIVIIGGVSGSGKTTIGHRLADVLAVPFIEADEFHSDTCIEKMRSGTPLTDDDRWPWLDRLAKALREHESQGGAILACSALKEAYRQRLIAQCQTQVQWVMLNGDCKLLKKRILGRGDHFFDRRLLKSQLDTLELPEYGLTIDVEKSISEVLSHILAHLQLP